MIAFDQAIFGRLIFVSDNRFSSFPSTKYNFPFFIFMNVMLAEADMNIVAEIWCGDCESIKFVEIIENCLIVVGIIKSQVGAIRFVIAQWEDGAFGLNNVSILKLDVLCRHDF